MKYKNIVFDFGNVIGTFNGREIIRSFVTDATDVDYLCDLIYAHWAELDSGAIEMKFCVRFPKGFMIPWIFSSVNGLAVQSHCHRRLHLSGN